MASIKKKSSGGGGANWMDTYGDMVTLLLCFFVLLYSISTIDQQKWLIVVKSFNRNAVLEPDDVPTGPVGNSASKGGDDMPATQVEQDLEELYEFLAAYAAGQEEGTITVTKGSGYVFISFADAVFFGGDSAAILPTGREVLDSIIPALNEAGPSIDELKVIGHTAQAGNRPNLTLNDRTLSGDRAAAVVAYVQDRIPAERLAPGRMLGVGAGQWRNVSPNDTEENKAKNRRVEMIVTGKDLDDILSDDFQKYQTMLKSTGTLEVSG